MSESRSGPTPRERQLFLALRRSEASRIALAMELAAERKERCDCCGVDVTESWRGGPNLTKLCDDCADGAWEEELEDGRPNERM